MKLGNQITLESLAKAYGSLNVSGKPLMGLNGKLEEDVRAALEEGTANKIPEINELINICVAINIGVELGEATKEEESLLKDVNDFLRDYFSFTKLNQKAPEEVAVQLPEEPTPKEDLVLKDVKDSSTSTHETRYGDVKVRIPVGDDKFVSVFVSPSAIHAGSSDYRFDISLPEKITAYHDDGKKERIDASVLISSYVRAKSEYAEDMKTPAYSVELSVWRNHRAGNGEVWNSETCILSKVPRSKVDKDAEVAQYSRTKAYELTYFDTLEEAVERIAVEYGLSYDSECLDIDPKIPVREVENAFDYVQRQKDEASK